MEFPDALVAIYFDEIRIVRMIIGMQEQRSDSVFRCCVEGQEYLLTPL